MANVPFVSSPIIKSRINVNTMVCDSWWHCWTVPSPHIIDCICTDHNMPTTKKITKT